jgi:hypothetical protein
MRRRDLITLVSGVAAGWPFAAHAQQIMLTIGILSSLTQTDSVHVDAADRISLDNGSL